jgi:hypothetical protein
MSGRNIQRKRQAYSEHGYDGLFDQRRGKRSIHRLPMATAERVLAPYRDFNVRHFHEKLREREGIGLSYRRLKQALQGAGLVACKKKSGDPRPRRPLPGYCCTATAANVASSRTAATTTAGDPGRRHQPDLLRAPGGRRIDTHGVMEALREVIEREGLFCALYSDRASLFFVTPKAGEPVDKSLLTQVGPVLKELGVQMIPAYSPQARGPSDAVSAPGRVAGRKNFAWPASPQSNKPTASCASITSPSLTRSSR